MRECFIVATAALILACALATLAATPDPFTGTWRLDPSQTLDSNPTQLMLKPSGNGISFQLDSQKPNTADYGKDSPLNNGYTINIVRVDGHTLSSIIRRDGQVVLKETGTASADGRRYTRIQERTGANGPYKTIFVFKRVGAAPEGDSFLGSWREEVSKTKQEPQLTYTLKVDGDNLDFATNRRHVITAKFDGKDYKQDGSDITMSLKRLDAQTIEILQKGPAAPSTTVLLQVRANMLIRTSIGTGAQEQPFKNTQYFERIK